jgi:CDP-diacylglycerol--glycerol-3-phosphate 3-phosphatidyltransferase
VAEQVDAPTAELSSRVWTIPNVLSMLRLAGVPVFLYWVLVSEQDGRAILLLMAAGASDYFDGLIARRYGQFTRLGALLDPLADRLYILATLLALVYRDGLPLWWALTLIGRDAVLSCFLPVLRRAGHGPLPVHFLGKAATFNLLYAFPMLLAALPGNDGLLATVFRPLGWAFAAWGERALPLGWACCTSCRCARCCAPTARRTAQRRVPGRESRCRQAGRSREGGRHGRRRGDPPAADDRQPAQAAAAGRQPADHGARPAAAEAARLRRDRRDGAVPGQPRAHLLR